MYLPPILKMKNKLSAAESRLDKKSVMPASGYQYRSRLMSVLALSVVCFPVLNAAEVNFETFESGLLASSIPSATTPPIILQPFNGLNVTAFDDSDEGGNNDNETYATVYNGDLDDGEDEDLERTSDGNVNWEAGNLMTVDSGGILIVQEAVTAAEIAAGQLTVPNGLSPNDGTGVNNANAPDDLGGGSRLVLTFTQPAQSVNLGLADVDEDEGGVIILTGLDANGNVATHEITAAALDGTESTGNLGTIALGNRTHNQTGFISACLLYTSPSPRDRG